MYTDGPAGDPRQVPVLCDEKMLGSERETGCQRWTLDKRSGELVNKATGFLLTIRNGSKASRAEVWCNYKSPLLGASDAQRWFLRRYDGEPKDPEYPINEAFAYLLARKPTPGTPSFSNRKEPLGTAI